MSRVAKLIIGYKSLGRELKHRLDINFGFLSFLLQTHMLFIDAFLQNNRLDHVTQVMGYHPLYLDIFLKTQNFILRGDGPLPYDYRHFIAIMVSRTFLLLLWFFVVPSWP